MFWGSMHAPDPPKYFCTSEFRTDVVCPCCALASAMSWLRHCCWVLAYASTYLLTYLQISARKELISGSRVSMIVTVAVWILPVLNSLCVVVSVKLTEKVSFDSISAVRITGIWTQPWLVLAAILEGNVPPR